ncbi:hypothetical protein TNCV_1121541 [Trichonephila clavipes]|nr:hypothetical protein TNCV_1121541 [Trichonephila clavipes]
MFESSSYVNPTPLAHADTSRDVLPRGGTSQCEQAWTAQKNSSLYISKPLRPSENFIDLDAGRCRKRA